MQVMLNNVRPTRRLEQPRLRKRKRGVSVRTAAIVAILFAAALVLISGRDPASGPPETQVVTAPPPEWVDIAHPRALFDLSAPQFAHLPQSYAARRNRLGGRQDSLTFGQLGGSDPFFQLTLYRVGREALPDMPLFVDLVRLGASSDIAVTRSTNPANVPTRFGPFETADIDLAAGAAAPVPCLGFRGAGLNGAFRLSGFACGTKALPMSRPALACLIDRLELDGGDDPALVRYFAQSERNRDGACAGTALAPNPVKASWIDQDDAPPPLRLRKMR